MAFIRKPCIFYRILMVLEFTNRQPLALGSTVVGCLNPVISCKSQHYSIFNWLHRQMMMRPRCNVVYYLQFINPRVIYTRRSPKQAVQSSCKHLLSRYVTFSSKFWTLFRENNYWLTRWDICLSTPSMAVVVNQRMKTQSSNP